MNTALRRDSTTNSIAFPRHSLELGKHTPISSNPVILLEGSAISNLRLMSLLFEQILRTILPQRDAAILPILLSKDPLLIEKEVLSLYESLPLLAWNNPDCAPCTLCVNLLCHSEFTHGVGRYVCDILTRWLIPGKLLNISSVHSMQFTFISCPGQRLFFHQALLDIDNDRQLALVKSNQENIEKEIRLSILAVRHARNIVSMKQLSPEQKKAMIEENICLRPSSSNKKSREQRL